MSAAMESFVPEYVAPEPGENGSLDAMFSCLADTTKALAEETTLHLEMFTDAEAAALLLERLRLARQALHELEATVEAATAQRMKGRTLAFAGYLVERKGGQKVTSWEHPRLAWAVLEDLTHDGTGTVDDAAADLLAQARDRLLKVAHVDYWRKGELRAMNVDPDSFSTTDRARHTIHITRTEDLRP